MGGLDYKSLWRVSCFEWGSLINKDPFIFILLWFNTFKFYAILAITIYQHSACVYITPAQIVNQQGNSMKKSQPTQL